MGMIRDSFVIFKNWAEAINALPDEFQLETYKALVSYGLEGIIPIGLSPVANAMLISFSTGMENSILRYNASIENGKLGGRPKKAMNVGNLEQNNVDNPQKNLEKPNKTQLNLDEPSHNLNVNDNVNVFSQSIKNINNHCVRVREKSETERQMLKTHFQDFWRYNLNASKDIEDLALEVIDTIIEACQQSITEERLKFNKKIYSYSSFYELILKLDTDDLSKIVNVLKFAPEPILNRPYYILGSVINRAVEKR